MSIRQEAERFARKHPQERPKWRQYRTDEQERILANAEATRRNLRAQARKLGYTGPKAIEQMLDAWLPNALEVFERMETPEAQAIGMVLERIAVALETMVENGRSVAPSAPVAAPTLGNWKCPVHGVGKVTPAGFSQRTQKAYAAFEKCPIQLPDGTWCPERPGGRQNGPQGPQNGGVAPAPITGVSEAPRASTGLLAPTDADMERLLP